MGELHVHIWSKTPMASPMETQLQEIECVRFTGNSALFRTPTLTGQTLTGQSLTGKSLLWTTCYTNQDTSANPSTLYWQTNIPTTLVCPKWAAIIRGVRPMLSARLVAAPRLTSSCIHSTLSLKAAACTGVLWEWKHGNQTCVSFVLSTNEHRLI